MSSRHSAGVISVKVERNKKKRVQFRAHKRDCKSIFVEKTLSRKSAHKRIKTRVISRFKVLSSLVTVAASKKKVSSERGHLTMSETTTTTTSNRRGSVDGVIQRCGLCSLLSSLLRRAMCVGSRRGSGESYYQELAETTVSRLLSPLILFDLFCLLHSLGFIITCKIDSRLDADFLCEAANAKNVLFQSVGEEEKEKRNQ